MDYTPVIEVFPPGRDVSKIRGTCYLLNSSLMGVVGRRMPRLSCLVFSDTSAMDRYQLRKNSEALLESWKSFALNIRRLRPLSEICRGSAYTWQEVAIDRAHVKRLYRRWLLRNHPDKYRDLPQDEKDLASFIIKEYGRVLHSTDKYNEFWALLTEFEETLSTWDSLPTSSSSFMVASVHFRVIKLQDRMAQYSDLLSGEYDESEIADIPSSITNIMKDILLLLDNCRDYHNSVESAYCESHSLNGLKILLGECFACAMKASAESFDVEKGEQTEEDLALDRLLVENGKKRYIIEPSGYCLVQAWHFAMAVALGKSHHDDWKNLLIDGLFELEYRPVFYNLVDNYKDEIARYRDQADYLSGAVDSLPFALANVTQMKCVIHQVSSTGFSYPIVITPMDIDKGPIFDCPEIELLLSHTRRHYDVVLGKFVKIPTIVHSEVKRPRRDELNELSIKQLKKMTMELNVDTAGCIEKRDLVDRIANALEKKEASVSSELEDEYCAYEDIDSDCVLTSGIDVSKDVDSEEATETNEFQSENDNDDIQRKHHKRRLNPQRSRKADMDIWKKCPIRTVQSLPYDIDGITVFRLIFDAKQRMKSSTDGRPWKTWITSSRKGFSGIRRITTCQGSYVCDNESCTFRVIYNKANKVQFQEVGGESICRVCGRNGSKLECPARKIWEFDDAVGQVKVFHDGNHICEAIKKPTAPYESLKCKFQSNVKTTPKQAADDLIVEAIADDFASWEEVLDVVDSVIDRKKVTNIKQNTKQEARPDGHSFEAVGKLRSRMKEKDPFLIYKINDRNLNGETSFVFKMSEMQAKLGIAMDRHENNFLCQEYCYFDGTFKRCPGYVTLAAYVYVSVLRRTVKLATMECEREATETIVLFWNHFNEVLSKYRKSPGYKFNPTGWCVDEHGGNWEGIRQVFGQDAVEQRTVSCEFHFLHSVEQRSKLITSPKSHDKFKNMAKELMLSTTPDMYNAAHSSIMSFIEEKPNKRKFLLSWIKWWHERRSHFARAFKPVDAVPVNLAEGYHSSYVTTSSVNLKLIDAAYRDIAEALRLKRSLELYGEGVKCYGEGPSEPERNIRDRVRQQKRADEYADVLMNEKEPANPQPNINFKIDPNSSHRPGSKRKKAYQDKSCTSSSEDEEGCGKRAKKGKNQERPNRIRKQRSKEFIKSLAKAKVNRFGFHLSSRISTAPPSQEFRVRGRTGEYTILISATPSCTCPFFIQRSRKVPCKHILWTMLYQLNIDENSYLLQQVALTAVELKQIFQASKQAHVVSPTDSSCDSNNPTIQLPSEISADSQEQFSSTNNEHHAQQQHSTTLTPVEEQAIFEGNNACNDPQGWLVAKLTERKKGCCCTCKSTMPAGKMCISANGLYIPPGQRFAVHRIFYFCADMRCINRTPVCSNLVTPPTSIRECRGRNLSNEDYALLRSRGLPVTQLS